MRRRTRAAARRPPLARLLRTALIAGVAAWLLLAHVAQVFRIEGASMEPALRPGERVLVEKIGTRLGRIGRGEVVVFENPRNPETILVKRVFGVPGDTVRFVGERVLVAPGTRRGDGQPGGAAAGFPEIASARGAAREVPRKAPIRVEEGTLFVLGDNRGASSDSRHWGLLPREAVIGRVVARISPGSRIGIVE